MTTTTKTKTPEKFTAALLHPADKERIINMRKETGLTEKDTMTAILDYAELHIDDIKAKAKEKLDKEAAEKEARRKAKYEETKKLQKMVRAQMRANANDKKKPANDAAETTADEPQIV